MDSNDLVTQMSGKTFSNHKDFREWLTKKLEVLEAEIRRQERESIEKAVHDLYEEFESNKPPLTFDRMEHEWNDGFYKGELKAMETVCQKVLGINGDTLEVKLKE